MVLGLQVSGQVVCGRDILCECTTVDSAQGDAECSRLEDIVVGEAFDQLDSLLGGVPRWMKVGHELQSCCRLSVASVAGTRV